MDKSGIIKRIWRECFPEDSAEWTDMYFQRTYSDENALTLDISGETVSSLLLQPYAMVFHGHTAAVSYISGAATKRKARGHGYMHTLMTHALRQSYDRGDMVCTLIPAQAWLTRYYAKLGFATVFYRKIDRYTSVHAFQLSYDTELAQTTDLAILYEAFCRLISQRSCYIAHSYSQFATIMEDNRLSGGIFRAVKNMEGSITAMAWAVPDPERGTMKVIESLYESQEAHDAVMHEIQCAAPGLPLTVWSQPPTEMSANLLGHGMARLVNVSQALSVIASSHRKLRICVRVTDPIIPQNNATYNLCDGLLSVSDDTAPDLDLTVDVLTALLFSSHRIGDIMGLPAVRPSMTLMLD